MESLADIRNGPFGDAGELFIFFFLALKCFFSSLLGACKDKDFRLVNDHFFFVFDVSLVGRAARFVALLGFGVVAALNFVHTAFPAIKIITKSQQREEEILYRLKRFTRSSSKVK